MFLLFLFFFLQIRKHNIITLWTPRYILYKSQNVIIFNITNDSKYIAV